MPKTKYTFVALFEAEADSHEEASAIGKSQGAVGMWEQSPCKKGCHVLNNLEYLSQYVQDLVFPEKKPTDIADIRVDSKFLQ